MADVVVVAAGSSKKVSDSARAILKNLNVLLYLGQ